MRGNNAALFSALCHQHNAPRYLPPYAWVRAATLLLRSITRRHLNFNITMAAAVWQGTLPSPTGPRDACDPHNPDKKATFYLDDGLPSSHTPTANLIPWLNAKP